jgi:hypothetical protein
MEKKVQDQACIPVLKCGSARDLHCDGHVDPSSNALFDVPGQADRGQNMTTFRVWPSHLGVFAVVCKIDGMHMYRSLITFQSSADVPFTHTVLVVCSDVDVETMPLTHDNVCERSKYRLGSLLEAQAKAGQPATAMLQI